MANKRFNKYLGAMTIGALILATPSCSDYDDHYFPTRGGESDATETLWEKISSDPNLSRFANILQHARYYKDDTHPVKNYTYADVLSSGQVCTVWAPENDYFTEEEYKEWLAMAETNGYNLEQQLVRNHIALWRHNLSGTAVDTIKMYNGKNLIFDRPEATMQGVKLNRSNIPAMNGVLHTLKGRTPFEYNFYEYIKYSGELPAFHEYFIGKDTTYFNSNASIEGLPDKNGNPTYVDSIYTTSNLLIGNYSYLPRTNQEKYMSAMRGLGFRNSYINAEDSMYIMILPTDAAWEEAYNKLKPLYKYAATYENRDKGNRGTNEIMKEYNADSLTEENIKNDLTYPLLFNIHKQPKLGGFEQGLPWTLEQFVQTVAEQNDTAEYLYNTYGDTIRSSEIWKKTELFNGECIKMSNGYGYKVNKWAFPLEYYMAPVLVEVTGGAFYYQSSDKFYTGTGQTKSFSNSSYADIANKYGRVSRDNFYLMKPKGTSHPKGEIKLYGNVRLDPTTKSSVGGHYSEVMSGKYDIYIVMVPNWYTTISDAGELDSVFYDSLYVDSIAALCKNKFKVQLRYNNGAASDATTKAVEIDYDAKKVDTIKVFENFTFPYSYKDLRFCYPTMIVQGSASSANLRNGYIRELCIDQVIMKGKEESEPVAD